MCKLKCRSIRGLLPSLLLAVFATASAGERPNIIMIVVDDMRMDEFGAGGHTYLDTPHIDSLAENGAMFTQAYNVTPLCSPNRASILTGQFVSRHGVLDNTSRAHASHQLDLFAKDLQSAGYRTAHVGQWHMGNDPTPRPGYDYWVSFAGQGKTNDPELYEDGRLHSVDGYITDIFTDRAIDFIRRNAEADSPFFVYIGHKAVHPEAVQRADGTVDRSTPMEFIPADRHKDIYKGKVFDRRPTATERIAARSRKPVLEKALQEREALVERDPTWKAWTDPGVSEHTVQRRAEMMLAVDESVGRLLAALDEAGELQNTLILFTSDNGYFFGEHALSVERRLPYEESVLAPLLVQYPERFEGGRKIESVVLSVDYAATILDAAGVTIPKHVQGRSFMPLLTGEKDSIRDTAYVEFYSHENPFPWTAKLDYRIVRQGDFKYIRWLRFEEDIGMELYNLHTDPYEQTNLAYDAEHAATLQGLQKALQELVVDAFGLADEP
jgi:N-acetylglucosamine-6-sulfatase